MRVILPPLDEYSFFQLACRFSILSKTEFQIALDLNRAPNGNPKCFIGNNKTLHPKIAAKGAILDTALIGTISDLLKLFHALFEKKL